MNETKYKHKEAFCVMRYASADGNTREVIWNSRDGVTPFVVLSRCGVEMSHVMWDMDRCEPNYQPRKGMRIFVDATPELLRPKAVEYVEQHWEDSHWPMGRHPSFAEGKAAAVEKILQGWCITGSPTIIEVQ